MKAKEHPSVAIAKAPKLMARVAPLTVKGAAAHVEVFQQKQLAKAKTVGSQQDTQAGPAMIMNSSTKALQRRPKVASFVVKKQVVTLEKIESRRKDQNVRAEIPFDLIELA